MAKTRWYVYMICSHYLCKNSINPCFLPVPITFCGNSHLFHFFNWPHFLVSQFQLPFPTFYSAPQCISFLFVPSLCHISHFPFCFFFLSQFTPFFLFFSQLVPVSFSHFLTTTPCHNELFLGLYLKAQSNFPLRKIYSQNVLKLRCCRQKHSPLG